MKKVIVMFLMQACAYASYATFTASLTAGFFYDTNGVALKSGKAAWVIDTQASDFSDFELKVGSKFEIGSFLDDSNRYFVLDIADLDLAIAYLSKDINLEIENPFKAGDTFAVVCWTNENDSAEIDSDTIYTFYSDFDWKIPQILTSFIDFEVLSEGAGGKMPEYTLTLNRTAIPEPSTVAVFAGAACLAAALVRRKVGA